MKSNVIIAVLVVVILLAGSAAVYFSLQKNARQDAEDNREAVVPKDNENGKTPPPQEPGEKPDQPDQPDKPDMPTIPKEDDAVDKLLSTIYRTQAGVYSLTAKITKVDYDQVRHNEAKTNADKMKAGDVAEGDYAYKPGNKFYAHLHGEAEEVDVYAYMQSLWLVTKIDGTTRASRTILGRDTMYEMLMVLQGMRPENVRRVFDIEILDTSDARTRNTLKSLGYTESEMPLQQKKRREILLLSYRDQTVNHRFDRIELVIDFVSKSGPETVPAAGISEPPSTQPDNPDEPTVPVIRMAKLYSGRVGTSGDDAPVFTKESIIKFTGYVIDFTGENVLSDDKFRYVPGPDVKVDDYITQQITGTMEILGRMQQSREFIAGFKAKFHSETVDPVRDEPEVHTGSLFYMERPVRFSMETEKIKAGSNGEKRWYYDHAAHKAIVWDLLKSEDSGEKAAQLPVLEMYKMLVEQRFYELQDEFDVAFDRPRDGRMEKINGADVLHLVLTRKENTKPPAGRMPKINYTDKIELWVEAETFLTIRVRTHDRIDEGKTQTITLSDIETDRALDAETFAVPKFPEETEIENR